MDTFMTDIFLILPNGGEFHAYDGNLYFFQNGKRHCEHSPAIQYWNGHKEWYINGERHREDGPAIEATNGGKAWYLNGEKIPCTTQEQFERLMRLKAFW
jgi:hypothetical protein